uniref:Uncharacterized protein n=1 Tax=Aegilops tauschii TaxID=37682 RepID=R7WFX8_AEGTA
MVVVGTDRTFASLVGNQGVPTGRDILCGQKGKHRMVFLWPEGARGLTRHRSQRRSERSLEIQADTKYSVLLELARSRNKIPLPKSIAPPGSIPLPPEQDTLLSENYQLLPTLKPPTQTEEAKDDNEGADAVPANPSPNYSQDQRGSEQHQSQSQSQRVSFQLNAVAAAAAKRPLVTIDQLNMG